MGWFLEITIFLFENFYGPNGVLVVAGVDVEVCGVLLVLLLMCGCVRLGVTVSRNRTC